jgi:hypothetical protein
MFLDYYEYFNDFSTPIYEISTLKNSAINFILKLIKKQTITKQ